MMFLVKIQAIRCRRFWRLSNNSINNFFIGQEPGALQKSPRLLSESVIHAESAKIFATSDKAWYNTGGRTAIIGKEDGYADK